MLILIVVFAVVISLLFVYFLGLQSDGGRLQLSPKLNTEQERELAQVLSLELAPGESLDITYHFYFIRADHMSVSVLDNVDYTRDWLDVEEPAGKSALKLTKEFHARNDIQDRFIFALPLILLIGWGFELVLVTVQTILYRRAKANI